MSDTLILWIATMGVVIATNILLYLRGKRKDKEKQAKIAELEKRAAELKNNNTWQPYKRTDGQPKQGNQ